MGARRSTAAQLCRGCLLCVYHGFLLIVTMMLRVRDLRSRIAGRGGSRAREIRNLARGKAE